MAGHTERRWPIPRSDWPAVDFLHFCHFFVNKFPSLLDLPVSNHANPVIGAQSPTRGGVSGFVSLSDGLGVEVPCVK